jgi:hypothetical protein
MEKQTPVPLSATERRPGSLFCVGAGAVVKALRSRTAGASRSARPPRPIPLRGARHPGLSSLTPPEAVNKIAHDQIILPEAYTSPTPKTPSDPFAPPKTAHVTLSTVSNLRSGPFTRAKNAQVTLSIRPTSPSHPSAPIPNPERRQCAANHRPARPPNCPDPRIEGIKGPTPGRPDND